MSFFAPDASNVPSLSPSELIYGKKRMIAAKLPHCGKIGALSRRKIQKDLAERGIATVVAEGGGEGW